ncbi:PAS domain S-box protein [bacterium]|nr:PAS domain S-box protein [bacterium]
MTNRRKPGSERLDRRDFNFLFRLFSESGQGAALIEGAGLTDCRINGSNRSLEELAGRSSADLYSIPLADFLAPGDLMRLLSSYLAIPQNEQNAPPMQVSLLRPDGSALPVEARVSRLRSAESPVSFILILRDLSGQRRLESSLRRQERLSAMLFNLDRLIDHSGDLRQTVLVSLDLAMELLAMETGAIYLNRAGGLRQACSRDPDEILPKSIPRQFMEQQQDGRCILHNPAGDEQVRLGLALRENSGVRCLLLQPFRVEKGGLLGLLAVACRKNRQLNGELMEQLDHLELRIARALNSALLIERLAESEAKYRAVLNNTAAGFALFRGSHLLEMNPSFERIMRQFTLQPAEVEAGLLFPENTAPGEILESESWEKELIAPDGQSRWLSVSRSQIDLTGRLFALFVRDNTERKLLESFRILSERLSASGSLAAGLAHEINNPLQAVTINLGLLARSLKPGRREQELLDGIHTGLNTIGETVRQLQEIHTPGRAPKRRLQVNHVLRRTLGLAAGQLEKYSVIVQASLSTRLPTIRGSSAALQRVFLNFVLNACEAMPEGGTLHVHTYLHRSAIYVRFTDTGVGIASEHLNRIFDAYYTTKSKSRGSGLGLSVALNLLRQHDGEVYVKSRPGLGTSFTVKLPL